MTTEMAVQVTIYLNQGDAYKGRPLHLELLKCLQEERIANAIVLHGVAGFVGGSRIKTSSLVDAGGKLPLMLIFVDEEAPIARVLPKVREMCAGRLIARENVMVESGAHPE